MDKAFDLTIAPGAVIFDLDGTLIASTDADYVVWKRLFAEYDVELGLQQYLPIIGRKSADILQSRLQLQGESLKHALGKKLDYFKEEMQENGMQIIPHADEILNRISSCSIKMALATSARIERVMIVLKQVNFLQYFDTMVTAEDVTTGKPSPEIFIKAAYKLGIAPADCIVFEDATSGVRAAKQAGMKCIAITTSHPAEALQEADLVINSFKEIDLSSWCR